MIFPMTISIFMVDDSLTHQVDEWHGLHVSQQLRLGHFELRHLQRAVVRYGGGHLPGTGAINGSGRTRQPLSVVLPSGKHTKSSIYNGN